MAPAPKPRKEGFKIECKCPDKDCDIDKEATKVSEYLGITFNAAALALAVLKEASGGSGVLGLRQAAGSALFILDTIQLMGDHKEAFKLLHKDAWDMSYLVVQYVVEKERKGEAVSPDLEVHLMRFHTTLDEIKAFVKEKIDRKWLMRVIFSRADKVKIDEYRIKLSQAITIFQLSAILNIHNNTEARVKKPETLKEAKATLNKVHDMAFTVIEGETDRRENIYITHTYSTGPVSVNYAPPSLVNSPNASIKNIKSYNVTTTTHQNANNDYSVNTINNYSPLPHGTSQYQGYRPS